MPQVVETRSFFSKLDVYSDTFKLNWYLDNYSKSYDFDNDLDINI